MWHVIVPDALFLLNAESERVQTLKHKAPTRLDLEEIVTAVAARSVNWLDKRGSLRKEGEQNHLESADTDSPWLRCLQGTLGVGELQRWPEHRRAEQNADQARGARGRLPPKPSDGLEAEHLRFNLHAGISVPGGLPAARERSLRALARPSGSRAEGSMCNVTRSPTTSGGKPQRVACGWARMPRGRAPLGLDSPPLE